MVKEHLTPTPRQPTAAIVPGSISPWRWDNLDEPTLRPPARDDIPLGEVAHAVHEPLLVQLGDVPLASVSLGTYDGAPAFTTLLVP